MYLGVKRSASEMSEEACIDAAVGKADAFALNRKRICVPAEIPPSKRLKDLSLRNYMEHPVRRKSRVFVPSVNFSSSFFCDLLFLSSFSGQYCFSPPPQGWCGEDIILFYFCI